MVRYYKMPKKYLRGRRHKGKCEQCGLKTNDLYSYVDESNAAITYHSPYLCKKCYREKYGR